MIGRLIRLLVRRRSVEVADIGRVTDADPSAPTRGTMAINRTFLFQQISLSLFDGTLKAAQKASIGMIVDTWETRAGPSDDRWLAYMLGTTHHETGRTMQPVRETLASSDARAIAILDRSWKAGRMPSVKAPPYWTPDPQGRCWLGRGFVQLTFQTNYARMSQLTGVDLVAHPDKAMDVDVATKILIDGMVGGAFTGKRLADFFSPTREDWVRARQIINRMDRAELVASYARKYYAAISYTM